MYRTGDSEFQKPPNIKKHMAKGLCANSSIRWAKGNYFIFLVKMNF